MTALEKIFQGYYEERLDGDKPNSAEMREAHDAIIKAVSVIAQSNGDVMEYVSIYGMQAEKQGFIAGFRMAWELLKNMQEGTEFSGA